MSSSVFYMPHSKKRHLDEDDEMDSVEENNASRKRISLHTEFNPSSNDLLFSDLNASSAELLDALRTTLSADGVHSQSSAFTPNGTSNLSTYSNSLKNSTPNSPNLKSQSSMPIGSNSKVLREIDQKLISILSQKMKEAEYLKNVVEERNKEIESLRSQVRGMTDKCACYEKLNGENTVLKHGVMKLTSKLDDYRTALQREQESNRQLSEQLEKAKSWNEALELRLRSTDQASFQSSGMNPFSY